ncbi:hypothetical protein V1264_016380 [Littorina saxatilis]|uniref:Uncharacterized protein n=1 Tax=Littorina saxatilis TaxID=31220 RepID=A0AAN9GJ56_9CAEN
MANTRFQFIDIICLLSLTLLLHEVPSVGALVCVTCSPSDPLCESGRHRGTTLCEEGMYNCYILAVFVEPYTRPLISRGCSRLSYSGVCRQQEIKSKMVRFCPVTCPFERCNVRQGT